MNRFDRSPRTTIDNGETQTKHGQRLLWQVMDLLPALVKHPRYPDDYAAAIAFLRTLKQTYPVPPDFSSSSEDAFKNIQQNAESAPAVIPVGIWENPEMGISQRFEGDGADISFTVSDDGKGARHQIVIEADYVYPIGEMKFQAGFVRKLTIEFIAFFNSMLIRGVRKVDHISMKIIADREGDENEIAEDVCFYLMPQTVSPKEIERSILALHHPVSSRFEPAELGLALLTGRSASVVLESKTSENDVSGMRLRLHPAGLIEMPDGQKVFAVYYTFDSREHLRSVG